MDQITCSYTSSSSSSSYEQQQQQRQNTIKSSKPSYHNSLHSVRKPLSHRKPTAKHFIAPLPPTPLKIYNVEPSNFKEVVRALTSTPEFQYPAARRLKDKAPPPLALSTVPKQSLLPELTPPPPLSPPLDGGGMMSPLSSFIMSPDFCNILNETMQTCRFTSSITGMDYYEGLGPEELGLPAKPVGHDPSGGVLMSPMGFGLSPTSFSWCSSVLFSPGTISTINQNPVL